MSIYTPTPEWLEGELEEEIGNLLRRIGIPGSLKGHKYLSVAIAKTAVSPDLIFAVTKALYPGVAKQCGITAFAAERNMRHAIKKCWDNGGSELLKEETGIRFVQRPTNSEYIDAIANYIRGRH